MIPQIALKRLQNWMDNDGIGEIDIVTLITAKEALEKQIPQKPKKVMRTISNGKARAEAINHNMITSDSYKQKPEPEYREFQYADYLCPKCNALTKEGDPSYCWRCGQALDWGDEE